MPIDDATSHDGSGAAPDEPGSQGCLLIAASYADVAQAVGPVVANAADRILAAPMLGDFVEVCFADGGPRPSADESDGCSGHARAVARIAGALTRPAVAADENYFALVIVDQSAAAVSRLLDACRSHPAIASLPLRYRGFAAMDDRPSPSADDQPAHPDVIVAPAGTWTERTLSAGLQQYAEELFRYFATTLQPGVTRAQLAEIRERAGLTEPVPAVSSSGGQDPALDLRPASTAPEQVSASGLPEETVSSAPSATPQVAGTASPPAHGAWVRRLAPRRLRGSALPGEQPDGPAQPEAPEVPVPVAVIAPVFLLLYGVTSPDEQVSWREARSLSVSLDRMVSLSRPVAFMMRAFSGITGSPKSVLQEAGRLSERDIKRPDPHVDFEQSLNSLRNALTSDLGALGRMARPAARPAVVIFAVDIPVADVISAEAYQRLAEQASVIWVVPERSADLLSPVFSAGGPPLTFHEGTASEIASLLEACALPVRPSDSAPSVPEPAQQSS
jgi:hypothetical protein